MHQESPRRPVQQGNGVTPSPVEQGGTPGLMTVVNAMLVGVPAAYAASHSIPITLITAVVTISVIPMGRWIR